jgi:hypothetical protein
LALGRSKNAEWELDGGAGRGRIGDAGFGGYMKRTSLTQLQMPPLVVNEEGI